MNTRELLKSFELSNYESEVYSALLKVERVKVQDLVKMVPVPRPMIYVSLKKLLDKGMCTENKGKVNHYCAVSPLIAFQDILLNEKEALQTKIKGIQKLNKVFKTKEKTDVPFEFVQVLKGNQIREFLNRAVNQAVKEILIFCKYPTEQAEKNMENSNDLEIKALKKGIKIRCLYETKCLNNIQFLLYSQSMIDHGEVAKVIDSLPMNMIVIDGKATFSLSHRYDNEVTVFLFSHPALISTLKYTFEYLWSKGTDIGRFFSKNKIANEHK